MKIMFLNVCHGVQEKQLKEFLIKNDGVIDIYCFQEASDDFWNITGDLFENYVMNSVIKKGEGGQVFYLTTLMSKNFEVPTTQEVMKGEKGVGIGLITEIKIDNNSVVVANVHGEPQPGNKRDNENRIRQSKLMIKEIERLDCAKIIGGDFNLDLETESVRMFEKAGYRNLIREYGIKTTRNNISWAQYPKEQHQMYADFVFVSPEVKVKRFEVIENEVSDHLPIILEIED